MGSNQKSISAKEILQNMEVVQNQVGKKDQARKSTVQSLSGGYLASFHFTLIGTLQRFFPCGTYGWAPMLPKVKAYTCLTNTESLYTTFEFILTQNLWVGTNASQSKSLYMFNPYGKYIYNI
jgi:hypothetical protein